MRYPKNEEPLEFMTPVVLKPFVFNDLKITVVNAIWLYHPLKWNTQDHMHPYYELAFIAEGAFSTRIAGREYLVSSGCASLVPPFCKHRDEKAQDTGADHGYCLRFALEKVQPAPQTAAFSVYDRLVERINALCGTAFPLDGDAYLEAMTTAGELGVQAVIIALLSTLADSEAGPKRGTLTDALTPKERALAEEAIFYLSAAGTATPDVEEMAKALYVSYRQLSRVFKKATGKGIIQYYNELRLRKAAKALVDSELPIKQIAVNLGFENESYFYALFQKTLGLSPGAYRRENRRAYEDQP